MKWIALIIAGGFVLYNVAKHYVDKLSISIVSLNLDDKSVTLRFVNPSPVEVKVNGFSVDIFYSGRKVGNVSRSESFAIPGNETVDFDASVVLYAATVGTAVINVIQNLLLNQTNSFTFVGTVKAYNFSIPVETTYAIS